MPRIIESLGNRRDLRVFGEELATEIARRHGAPVQMMHLKHGIFDDGTISVIASETVLEIARLAGLSPDVRRCSKGGMD